MNVDEARKQVNAAIAKCESSTRELRSSAAGVATAAEQAANRAVGLSYIALSGCGLGLILWALSHPVFGTLFIIAGIVVCVNLHKSLSAKAAKIKSAAQSLRNSVSERR